MKRLGFHQLVLGAVAAVLGIYLFFPSSAETADDEKGKGNANENPVIFLQGGGFGGGFGGGGLGGGGGGDGFLVVGIDGIPMVDGFNVAVVVAEDQGRIAAYSVRHGEWHIQSFEEAVLGDAKLVPIVSTDLVSVSLPDRVYAYSAISGNWVELKIPVGAEKTVTVNHGRITVRHGDNLSMFSGQTGTWSSINWKRAKKINWNAEQR